MGVIWKSKWGVKAKMEMKEYTESVKARMVARLVGPRAVSAMQLSRETGIAQGTLSRWLRGAAKIEPVAKQHDRRVGELQPGATGSARRNRVRSGADKLAIVARAAELHGETLGAFLRGEGVHLAELEEWRKLAEEALGAGRRLAPAELARKDKALAETAALLVLKKKVAEIWGDEDDDMGETSD